LCREDIEDKKMNLNELPPEFKPLFVEIHQVLLSNAFPFCLKFIKLFSAMHRSRETRCIGKK